jgi:hemerythrin-like domain-containing protein
MRTAFDNAFGFLVDDHEELHRLFDNHQRALLAKDIDTAMTALLKFQHDLERHIDFEETLLLPKYAQEGGETTGGTMTIFLAEHRKLREMLDKLSHETLALYAASDVDAKIIEILDQEALFKGLLSHHALREHNILIPRLESRTTPAERDRLLKKHAALATGSTDGSPNELRFVDAFAAPDGRSE